MKTKHLLGVVLLTASASAMAAIDLSAAGLATGIISTVIYGLVGIIMAAVGYKVIDWLTPGSLREQIAEHENRALAILTGSMVLGICIIIAAVLAS